MLPNAMPSSQRLLFELHARLPAFKRKVERARALVEEAMSEMTSGYCAYSSGKDSEVVADLVWHVRPDLPAVYFDADCAYPESIEYLDYTGQHHQLIKRKTEPILDTFARLGGINARGVERATMESTVYQPVRELLADYGFDGVFLGLRGQESEGRAMSAKYHGKLYRYKRDGVLRCLPVADWGYRDIWAYILSQDLPYNRIYDLMWDLPEESQRVSYWAGETGRTVGRYTWLRLTHPELFNELARRFPEVRQFI